jgi:hypothetical protein
MCELLRIPQQVNSHGSPGPAPQVGQSTATMSFGESSLIFTASQYYNRAPGSKQFNIAHFVLSFAWTANAKNLPGIFSPVAEICRGCTCAGSFYPR